MDKIYMEHQDRLHDLELDPNLDSVLSDKDWEGLNESSNPVGVMFSLLTIALLFCAAVAIF